MADFIYFLLDKAIRKYSILTNIDKNIYIYFNIFNKKDRFAIFFGKIPIFTTGMDFTQKV